MSSGTQSNTKYIIVLVIKTGKLRVT